MRKFLTIKQAAAVIGSRTKTYELIGQRKFQAVKLGTRTMIDEASFSAFLERLPIANIGSASRRKAAE